jgi:outer membrane protein insertion porin family
MKSKFTTLRGWSRSLVAGAALVACAAAWAVDPFVLKDIQVEGLQRVEPGTVFASLPFRVGETYSEDKGAQAIRALFGLGLFSDVRIEVRDGVVVVVVAERPIVADIRFDGVKEFDAEVLRKALRDIGLAEGRPFDKALADRAEQELKRQYLNRSLYAAEVVTTQTPGERNRVNLSFSVVEGPKTRIRSIDIVGNEAFSDKALLSLLDQDTGGWLSWYTKSNQYSRNKFNGDLETLRSHYLTRGYLEFQIDSTQVAISPDKSSLDITINITEGKRYAVASVSLVGDYLGREAEFQKLVALRPGGFYNVDDVTATTKAFSDYFGRFGYAFAQVDLVPKLDRERGRVDFVVQAQPQRRVYVRRINVEGNNRTRDAVIRREFRQFEAAWYDFDKIRLSRDRVDRLGFFTEVEVENEPVPGSSDQVDLVVRVTEKPTGNLSLGAGYSQAEKLSLIAGIKQENVFGSGNYLGLDLNTSSFNRQFVMTAVNPYFTDAGVSQSVDLYYRTARPYNAQASDYRIVTKGAGVRYGVPFTERDTVFFGLSGEKVTIDRTNRLPVAYADQGGTYLPATVGWARDERDSALIPSKGSLQRLNLELGLGGKKYTKAVYQFQNYWPLTRQYTVAMNSEVGWGKGVGGNLPVLRNFTGGGLGSVRGFEQGTLGGRSPITGSPTSEQAYIGGDRSLLLNLEFIAPLPGAGNDKTLRWFSFVDVGNVYGAGEKLSASDLRASAGLGISWISPVGPLRLAFATPVRKKEGDKIQRFQFQIGTAF